MYQYMETQNLSAIINSKKINYGGIRKNKS